MLPDHQVSFSVPLPLVVMIVKGQPKSFVQQQLLAVSRIYIQIKYNSRMIFLSWKCVCYYFAIYFEIINCKFIAPWIRENATECSEKCGLKYGESGVPGIVACSVTREDGCDINLKPEPLRCPATASCEETAAYVSTTIHADSHNIGQHEQNEKVNFPGENDASNGKMVAPLPQGDENNGVLLAMIISSSAFVAVLIIVIVLVVVLRRRKNLKRNGKIQPSHSPHKQTQQDITKTKTKTLTKGPKTHTHSHRSRHRQSRGSVAEKDDLVVDHHDSTWQLSGHVDAHGRLYEDSVDAGY